MCFRDTVLRPPSARSGPIPRHPVPRVYARTCTGCATTTSQADRKFRKTLSIIIAPAPITRSPVPSTNPDFRVGRDRYRPTLSSFFPFPSFTYYGCKWERRECLEICKNDRGLEEISFALKIRILCFTIRFFFHLPFSFLFLSYVYNYARKMARTSERYKNRDQMVCSCLSSVYF